jgi:hypothetical protein
MIHLQAGHSKEDSLETKDIVFYDNIPISQSSKPCTSAPTETGKNSLFEPTPMTKEPGETLPTFFHEEYNDKPIETPQNDESCKANKFIVGNGPWKEEFFARKNHKEDDEPHLNIAMNLN